MLQLETSSQKKKTLFIKTIASQSIVENYYNSDSTLIDIYLNDISSTNSFLFKKKNIVTRVTYESLDS